MMAWTEAWADSRALEEALSMSGTRRASMSFMNGHMTGLV